MPGIREGNGFWQDVQHLHVLGMVPSELRFLRNGVDRIPQDGVIGLSKSRYIEVKGDISTVLDGFYQESPDGFPQVVRDIVHVTDAVNQLAHP